MTIFLFHESYLIDKLKFIKIKTCKDCIFHSFGKIIFPCKAKIELFLTGILQVIIFPEKQLVYTSSNHKPSSPDITMPALVL